MLSFSPPPPPPPLFNATATFLAALWLTAEDDDVDREETDFFVTEDAAAVDLVELIGAVDDAEDEE